VTHHPIPIRALPLLLALAGSTAPAHAQTAPKPTHKPRHTRPTLPAYNLNTVFLDPAHGGTDPGATLAPNTLEKDLNRSLAERIRTLLTEKGFTAILFHTDSDLSPDDRAALANRARPVACILLHATTAGRGLHLFTASLAIPGNATANLPHDDTILPWDSAQATYLPRSLQLATELATAFNYLKVPVISGRASIPPIDSLTCPAVILEVAPPAPGAALADEAYQQHIAEAILTALTFWRDNARTQMEAQQPPPPANPAPEPAPTLKPRREPPPKPVNTPEESPLAPDTAQPHPPSGGAPR